MTTIRRARPCSRSQGKLTITSFDPSGNSVGYNVLDSESREWKAKVQEDLALDQRGQATQ